MLEGLLRVVAKSLESGAEKGRAKSYGTEVPFFFLQAGLTVDLVHVHDLTSVVVQVRDQKLGDLVKLRFQGLPQLLNIGDQLRNHVDRLG